ARRAAIHAHLLVFGHGADDQALPRTGRFAHRRLYRRQRRRDLRSYALRQRPPAPAPRCHRRYVDPRSCDPALCQWLLDLRHVGELSRTHADRLCAGKAVAAGAGRCSGGHGDRACGGGGMARSPPRAPRRSSVSRASGGMTVDVRPEVAGSSAGRAVTSACADGKPRRRVLIVTSSYAPAMIADMHRARHLAWELPTLGWAVDILAPSASLQAPSYLDHDSSEFFAET